MSSASPPPPSRGTSCNTPCRSCPTHDNQRVTEALNLALQAALTGKADPDRALADAQATATRLLKDYR